MKNKSPVGVRYTVGSAYFYPFFAVIVGAFGLMFYPHKISYILAAVFGIVGCIIAMVLENFSFLFNLWLGVGLGFIPAAIISRFLHVMKKI